MVDIEKLVKSDLEAEWASLLYRAKSPHKRSRETINRQTIADLTRKGPVPEFALGFLADVIDGSYSFQTGRKTEVLPFPDWQLEPLVDALAGLIKAERQESPPGKRELSPKETAKQQLADEMLITVRALEKRIAAQKPPVILVNNQKRLVR